MSGKSLQDYDYGAAESRAYAQGCADTHERYEVMQARAHEWLAGVLALIAEWETHHSLDLDSIDAARELREAVSLDPSVKLACGCESCMTEGDRR